MNNCSDKTTILFSCAQKVLIDVEGGFAFFKSFTVLFKNWLCVEDVSDEKYEIIESKQTSLFGGFIRNFYIIIE